MTVQNATLAASLNDFSGVFRFLITGNLTLTSSNALGGAPGTSPAPVEVPSGGSLSVANATAVNSNVLLHANSTLQLGASLSGTGIFSRDNAPMNFVINAINGLTGTQVTPSFIQPGDSVTLPTNNVLNLQSLPALNYIFPANGGVSTSGTGSSYIAFSQAAGLNVNGGSIRFLSTSPSRLVEGPLPQGDSALHIGPAGATISAPGSAPTVNTSIFTSATIDVRIIAQGPITIGAAPANGAVAFTDSLNTLSTINVNAPFIATIPGRRQRRHRQPQWLPALSSRHRVPLCNTGPARHLSQHDQRPGKQHDQQRTSVRIPTPFPILRRRFLRADRYRRPSTSALPTSLSSAPPRSGH